MDLEDHILLLLRGMRTTDRPATIGDISRRFGASRTMVAGCIEQMVNRGTAQPAMILVDGVSTLHGLMGQAEPAPVAAAAG